MLTHIFRRNVRQSNASEECFYVKSTQELNPDQVQKLEWFLREPLTELSYKPFFSESSVREIGPQLSFETPFSSNVVSRCVSLGLPIERIEKSVRYVKHVPGIPLVDIPFDRMTQTVYEKPLTTFETGFVPDPVTNVLILEHGEQALRDANAKLGLGMDDWDIAFYTKLFKRLGRNATIVECFQVGNANSEHSRHWYFRGLHTIDGNRMPESLMDIIKAPWKRNPNNNLVAFHDNAGVITGCEVDVLLPLIAGRASPFIVRRLLQHLTATAETHNHPTMIAPFPGAETGAGGRMRDNRAVGRGGLVHAGFSGYCVADTKRERGKRYASPLEILIQGSNGVSDYGNKIGEPLVGGFCRSFDLEVEGELRAFYKPVLYTAGLGRILDCHLTKKPPQEGMLIVRFGGPAYRIGVGGGAASSMGAGMNSAQADQQSVQRGDAEYENRANRVIQACAELIEKNPIEAIHDQGAGGPSNVITELMEPKGGRIDIRCITVGDKTMSILEIWGAEYQEGYGALVRRENIQVFTSICERERVNCEVLGEVTGDGNITVFDGETDEICVDLPLADILSEMPPKKFTSEHLPRTLLPLALPNDLSVENALRSVFSMLSVHSKGFLVHKVDRSVTGLVARQQCVGPMQIAVADVAVTADGYFGLTGAAGALGENPNRMLIDPAAGARMAVAEMLTNILSASITSLTDVACRVNWMWAAKRPGQGALLHDAALAVKNILTDLKIAANGGKDSLSMEALVEHLEGTKRVMSPGELVIFGYAPVKDITKVVTPDFKGGCIIAIDLGGGKNRMGGSALAQSFGQLGNESSDIDNPDLLKRACLAIQELIAGGLVSAYHDRSDGGLITTVAEMAMAGECGAHIWLPKGASPIPYLFAEEAGMVFECSGTDFNAVRAVLYSHGVPFEKIGRSYKDEKSVVVECEGAVLLSREVCELRQWWEEKSSELDMHQANSLTVSSEKESHGRGKGIPYALTFTPSSPAVVSAGSRPRIAVLREEGSNGDREMVAAFTHVGCEVVDITMKDILSGEVGDFDAFQGLVYPGGFSFADVLGSGRAWAAPVVLLPSIREKFKRFYEREDTLSLGVCNGCQFERTVGWMLYKDLPEASQPRMLHNLSGRFESRWSGVRILKGPSVHLKGMEGSVLGIHVAHGEGRFYFPDEAVFASLRENNLVPLVHVDPDGESTEMYPYNPNGSPFGVAALCSPDGRHLSMMPHPERCFLPWQWPWTPDEIKKHSTSPWLQMFVNARDWCIEHK